MLAADLYFFDVAREEIMTSSNEEMRMQLAMEIWISAQISYTFQTLFNGLF